MALKGDRAVYVTDIGNVTESVSKAGELLILKTGQTTTASGQGINDLAPVAAVVGTGNPPSGTVVLGAALDPVVDVDETKGHRNWHTGEQVVGEPVALLTDGWIYTDMVTGTPSAGAAAYVGASGNFTDTQVNSIPAVGRFLTSKDPDGYAKVYVKLP